MDTRRQLTLTILLFFLHMTRHKCNGFILKCPLHQMHFQKIIGFRPSLRFANEANLLYSPITITHSGLSSSSGEQADDNNNNNNNDIANITQCNSHRVVPICWQLCHNDDNCVAYVHFLDSDECYGFTYLPNSFRYQSITSDIRLEADFNAIYFEKTCLRIPDQCENRLWAITKIPGNSLVFQGKKTLSTLVTKRECAEKCLFETEFKCLSASFLPSFKNNKARFDNIIFAGRNSETLGRCILSNKDKMIQPDAFRAAPFDEEYIENQCHERPVENGSCAYELYSNSSFVYAEGKVNGLTQKECQACCSHETRFFCNGVSYSFNYQDPTKSECWLHSEDIISMGPRSLKPKPLSMYMRRVKCLDVTVICTADEMTIKYTPKDSSFRGKIYVNSHSEDCSAIANGTRTTLLRLPIGSETKESRCGILRAYEVTKNYQRIFISALVVVQNNLNVQTQGDRVIKVGCIVNNSSNSNSNKNISTSEPVGNDGNDDGVVVNQIPNAVALASSFAFTQNNFTDLSDDGLPEIKLQIIDVHRQSKTKYVRIGEKLELQIDAHPIDSGYDFRATSLVAKAEDKQNFVLLIDNYGCPTDTKVFPALTRIRTERHNGLRARFHAFKFAGTSLVSFELTIHFCKSQCPLQNCQPTMHANGYENFPLKNKNKDYREKREFTITNPIYVSTIETQNENVGKFEKNSTDADLKLPLNYDLHVRGPNLDDTNGYVYGERGVLLIANIDSHLDDVCINQSLLIAIFIFCLIIQLIFMFSCCFVLQKYKGLTSLDDEKRKIQESLAYLESRRVHWADQGGCTL